jgi:hypothetical protein
VNDAQLVTLLTTSGISLSAGVCQLRALKEEEGGHFLRGGKTRNGLRLCLVR